MPSQRGCVPVLGSALAHLPRRPWFKNRAHGRVREAERTGRPGAADAVFALAPNAAVARRHEANVTTPTVSVVIPTRNRRALLKEAVESVERQTLQHWELVIVDDASDDGTWAWLSSVADPRVRVIRQDAHAERSAARNRGLAEANGRFILFLDDDDRLFPKALERLARALERRPHVVASVGGGCPADRGTWWRPPEGSYGQAVTARADSGVSAVARRSASASWGSCLKPLMRRN